jgi:hypothetical protein
MKHLSEEELIACREGDQAEREAAAAHLAECAECRAELAQLETELTAVFAALDAEEVPEAGEGYGQRVWSELAPKLTPYRTGVAGAERVAWWREWFAPRHLLAGAAIAALVVMAFFAGRKTTSVKGPEVAGTGTTAGSGAGAANMREKVLWLAVGEHLGRSEMMLTELANTEAERGAGKLVNISATQKRADDLLAENRLYRQTALEQGDAGVASVLDELERVLLDVAHTPEQVSAAQLTAMQQRIAADGILFKVRVVGQQLEQRQRATPVNGLQENRKKV